MNWCACRKVGALQSLSSEWSVGGGGKVMVEQPAAPYLRPLPVILMQLAAPSSWNHQIAASQQNHELPSCSLHRRTTLNTVTALKLIGCCCINNPEPGRFYCSTVGTQVINRYALKWVGTQQVSCVAENFLTVWICDATFTPMVPLMPWSMWLIDANCPEISSDSDDSVVEMHLMMRTRAYRNANKPSHGGNFCRPVILLRRNIKQSTWTVHCLTPWSPSEQL